MNSPGAQYATGDSGEITPERMKGLNQSKNNTQLWMWLVIEARSDAVKSNIAQEPGMLGPWVKVIGSGQTGDDKSEHRHSRNRQLRWAGMQLLDANNQWRNWAFSWLATFRKLVDVVELLIYSLSKYLSSP